MYVPVWLLHSLEGISVAIVIIIVVMCHWYIHESRERMDLMREMARILKENASE